MPSYKLTYFDGRGRAEVARLLFAAAGVKYEDVRLTREEWPEFKPKTPMEQIPVLEVDGKMFSQSVAIFNFLAREFGLYGKNNLESFAIDEIVQTVSEFVVVALAVYQEQDAEKKEEKKKTLTEEQLPKYYGRLNKIWKENGTGYFVGSSLTLADLVVYDVVNRFNSISPGSSDKFEDFQSFTEKLLSNEKVKTYLDNRKDTFL